MSGTELAVHEAGMRLEDIPPTERPADPPERAQNPRDVAMARIAAHYEEIQRGHELDVAQDMRDDAVERGEPQPEDERPARQSHADGGARAHEPQPQQPTRTVNIQGQAFQVDEAQYARLAELGAVANVALQQAQQQQAPQQWPPPAQQYQQPPSQAYRPAPGEPLIGRAEAERIVNNLSYGGQEDGVAAVQELAASIAARQPDPRHVAAEATRQAVATIELNNNLNRIGQEYPDVFNDETRAYVAAVHLIKLRQEDAAMGRTRPDLDLYRQACGRVREALTPQQQRNGRSTSTNGGGYAATLSSDRLERKRNAPAAQTAASRASSLGPEPSRAKSNAQIIDEMRRARGQMPIGR